MMTIAQILKHVDGTHPVRFLIAETETGYTLLAALWLARHYGIATSWRSRRCSRRRAPSNRASGCSTTPCATRTGAST